MLIEENNYSLVKKSHSQLHDNRTLKCLLFEATSTTNYLVNRHPTCTNLEVILEI